MFIEKVKVHHTTESQFEMLSLCPTHTYTLHRICVVVHFQLLTRVSGVHTVFVTGLVFIPLQSKVTTTSSVKQVSKPEKLVLISVSADRTCSGTLVRRKSGWYFTTIHRLF